MERHIKLADVEAVVKDVYEKYKDLEVDGETDPRLKGVDASKFGIAVTLTDGRTVTVGDVDTLSPLRGHFACTGICSASRAKTRQAEQTALLQALPEGKSGRKA